MTRAEKLLYQQIHPLKLLTDFATSFASSWLLWTQRWLDAGLVGLVPSVVVTVLLVTSVDLSPYRQTPIGRYVAAYMTRRVEALRLSGQVVMWIGAGMHVPWLLPLGLMIVVYGWLHGLWVLSPDDRSR